VHDGGSSQSPSSDGGTRPSLTRHLPLGGKAFLLPGVTQ